jgi:hypothetical protein
VKPVSRGIDRVKVVFDEPGLVADAGLILVATLVSRLGLEALVDTTVRFTDRAGGFRPGRKVLTLVHAMVAGASHIDHAERLRAGATGGVLGHRVMAPSTLGSFLRAFSFGHVRQLDAVIAESLRRAWALGTGPGTSRLVVDIDSTICQVYGRAKSGAAYGYTKVLGYHPIVAVRAGSGEILHARMRKGSANTARGTKRFVEELVARARRAGASGEIVMRFDSGFWSNATIAVLGRLDVRFTMAVRCGNSAIAGAIAAIAEASWVPIAYTPDGIAEVAETGYKGHRLVVRRTRLVDVAQQALFPGWRHHGFLSDLEGSTVELDRFHRPARHRRARHPRHQRGLRLGSLPVRELRRQRCLVGLRRARPQPVPLDRPGGPGPPRRPAHRGWPRCAHSSSPCLPALVNHAGTPTLRGPLHWPWQHRFDRALAKIRALPASRLAKTAFRTRR